MLSGCTLHVEIHQVGGIRRIKKGAENVHGGTDARTEGSSRETAVKMAPSPATEKWLQRPQSPLLERLQERRLRCARPRTPASGVWGLGFRVQGAGCRV